MDDSGNLAGECLLCVGARKGGPQRVLAYSICGAWPVARGGGGVAGEGGIGTNADSVTGGVGGDENGGTGIDGRAGGGSAGSCGRLMLMFHGALGVGDFAFFDAALRAAGIRAVGEGLLDT